MIQPSLSSRVLMAVSLLALAGRASAQQALTGTITGAVLDTSDAGVPNAKVTARNLNTGLERSGETNSLGAFTLSTLPVGEYEVTTSPAGFAPVKTAGVRVGVGVSVTVDLRVQVGATTTQVNVTGDVAAIEVTRSGVASSVDNKQISNLGLNGRDFLNFVLLTPGVTKDVRTGDLSFGGQRGTLNNIQVDGSDNNNNFYGQALGRTGTGRAPYQFSVDSVEEFQVNSSGFSAEFGRAGGAVINVVTKSGTNDFHGSAFEYFRDRYMNANTFINNSRGIARQPFHVNQFGATVGGPVIKNKDFFFFNYDGQRRTLPNAVFLGTPIPAALFTAANAPAIGRLNALLTPYTLGFNQNVLLIKNDWQITDNHRLSVRYNRQGFNGPGLESSGSQVALEHSGIAEVKTDTITASLSSVISPKLINEFRFQYSRDDEPGTPNTLGPETVLRQNGITALTFGSSSISPRFANIKGTQFADNVTRTSGRHTVKAGIDINHNTITNYFAGNARGSYTFNTFQDFFDGKPTSYVQAFPGANTPGFTTKPSFTELGFYVQDEFRWTSKLTLNLGLRYDYAMLTKPPVKNPDPQLAAFGIDTSALKNDPTNFGPRFGFAYKPLSSNKLVVRGGYGIFYGRVPQILISTAYNQNGVSASSLTFTGAAIPTYPANFTSQPGAGTLAKPSILFFDDNFVMPRILQGSIGVEYEIMPRTTLAVTYLNVHGVHLARTRDINLFPAQPITVDVPGFGSRTQLRYPGPQGNPSRPMSNFARAELFESGAGSMYNGFTLALNRRFQKNVQFGLSYTLSKVTDTVPDFTSVVPFNGGDEAKMAQHPTQPNLDRGAGVNDQRHRVVANFLWDLNYLAANASPLAKWTIGGWQVSGIITAQSGQPYSAAVGGDPNNDGNTATDRVAGLDRNTLYGPSLSNYDLRLTKSLPVWKERVKALLALDLFNAFNQSNFLAGDIRNGQFNSTTAVNAAGVAAITYTPTTNFGTYSKQTLDNRILQVSLKINF